MDPLSITASTITVITAVSATFKGAKRLYNAPGEIESILNDLADTQVNLKWIEDGLQQYRTSNRCDERQYQELGKQLLLAKATVQELLKSIKLDSVNASPDTASARWAWVRAKGKVKKLKHRVEGIRAVIVRLQASFERTSIHLELRSVSLSAAEAKSTTRTILDTSLSSNSRLEQIADNQRLQEGELVSLRSSQEQILRLLEEGRQPAYRAGMATSKSTFNSGGMNKSSSLGPKRPGFDTVVVTTAYRSNSACVSACFCACHSQRTFETPSFLQQAIGRLFVGYVGIPLLTKPCDTASCKRQGSPSWYSQYHFPRWYLQQTLLPLFAVITSFQPPRFTLEVPRVIDPESPVFQHALAGDVASLQRLFTERLASPTDINAQTGRTLLHYAFVRSHNPDLVRLLLTHGADPHIRDNTGWQVTDTLWEMRFATNDHHMFSDVFTTELPAERRFTDLHLAVLKYGYMDLDKAFERLTSSALSIDTVDSNGRTALSWATHRGDIEIVQRLLRHGADSSIGDKYGVVPLHLAAHNDTIKCMEALLSHGADVHQTDIHGRTAAHYSCEYQNPLNGQAVQMLRLLQNYGADVLKADKYSRTGLHKSAAVGNTASLNYLLHEGCDEDRLDDWGKSALVDAIKRNQHKILEALLQFGPPNNYENLGVGRDSSLLHVLATDADLRALRILYKHRLTGLNVNRVDGQGRTAQDLFDARSPPPEKDLMEVWYMLLTQLEGDEFTDGTGSEKSWLFEEALEDQLDPFADAKKVYGLE